MNEANFTYMGIPFREVVAGTRITCRASGRAELDAATAKGDSDAMPCV